MIIGNPLEVFLALLFLVAIFVGPLLWDLEWRRSTVVQLGATIGVCVVLVGIALVLVKVTGL